MYITTYHKIWMNVIVSAGRFNPEQLHGDKKTHHIKLYTMAPLVSVYLTFLCNTIYDMGLWLGYLDEVDV